MILSRDVEDEYRAGLLSPAFDRVVSVGRRRLVPDVVTLAATWDEVTDLIRACTDPKDNKYLSLAVASSADAIVSGDGRHFLAMRPPWGTPILSPAAFVVVSPP